MKLSTHLNKFDHSVDALIKTLIHTKSHLLEALIKVKFWPDLVAKTIIGVQPTARGPNLQINALEVDR